MRSTARSGPRRGDWSARRGYSAGCARGRLRELAKELFHRQQSLQMHQFHQAEFQVQTLLLPKAEVIEGAQHDLQKARELFLGKQHGRAHGAAALVRRNLQQVAGVVLLGERRDLCDDAVAQVTHKLPRNLRRGITRIQQPPCCAEYRGGIVARDGLEYLFKDRVGHRAHQLADFCRGEFGLAIDRRCRRNRLVHDGERIAHGAIARLRQQSERGFVGKHTLVCGNAAQLVQDVVELDRVKAEVLASRPDGLRNVLRLGGRHHEDDVVRRLLQGLKQRVKSGIRNLVRFVKDVNLEAVACGPIARGIAQLANLVDAAVRRSINLDHIDRVSRANLKARVADAAWLRRGPLDRADGVAAVKRGRKNARDRRLSNATMPAEDVAVRNAVLLQRVLQRACDVVLPGHIGEALRTILAGKDLVSHPAQFTVLP